MEILPKVICTFNNTRFNIHAYFLVEINNIILKFCRNSNNIQISKKNSEKSEQSQKTYTYYKAALIQKMYFDENYRHISQHD